MAGGGHGQWRAGDEEITDTSSLGLGLVSSGGGNEGVVEGSAGAGVAQGAAGPGAHGPGRRKRSSASPTRSCKEDAVTSGETA